ncbi:MAG: helix-turn-helix transcriptional regulator [Lachnospiraceae bacterium]|nr:helix-turn-helix transcriptional regulator [Lachnospiraceae bacterium]
MGITEKLATAKKTNWISEGFSEAEIKTMVDLAKISARIERRRLEMQMTQKEFADYMGVTQGMVSKWEGRDYNFTIKTLNEICKKLDLDLSVSVEKSCACSDYSIVRWESEKVANNKSGWSIVLSNKEAIA